MENGKLYTLHIYFTDRNVVLHKLTQLEVHGLKEKLLTPNHFKYQSFVAINNIEYHFNIDRIDYITIQEEKNG